MGPSTSLPRPLVRSRSRRGHSPRSADTPHCNRHVRFPPESGHCSALADVPLLGQSGHCAGLTLPMPKLTRAAVCQVLGRQFDCQNYYTGLSTAGVIDVRGFGPRSRSACIGRGFCHAPVSSHCAFTGHRPSDLRQMRRTDVAHAHRAGRAGGRETHL
jgi:hypothetical protein